MNPAPAPFDPRFNNQPQDNQPGSARGSTARQRLQAPAENFGITFAPHLETFLANLSLGIALPSDLAQLREQATAEALTTARQLHAELGLQPGRGETNRLLLTGHQPEFFHPGVWAKDFALAALADRLHMTAVHLVVDSDLVKSAGLSVPDLREAPGQVAVVPYAEELARMTGWPHEEILVRDWAEIATFPQRVHAHFGGVEGPALLDGYWPSLVASLPFAAGRWAWAIVRARRLTEQAWGVYNWELPLSRLCMTASFARFIGLVIQRAAEFVQVHNAALADFRRRHRLRSQAHPAPDLQLRDGTCELPFWVWHRDRPRRQRLFAARRHDGWEWGFWEDGWQPLPVVWPERGTDQPQALQRLSEIGWRVRSRALTTTLFARLFLGTGFIHGLGGGLYDEVTDQLMRDFFGVAPPPTLVVSATLHLRAQGRPEAPAQYAELVQRLWASRWHAERWLDLSGQTPAKAVWEAKAHWVQRMPTSAEERRLRCRQLKALNAQLAEYLAHQRRQWHADLKAAEAALHLHDLTRSREWSFLLHHPDDLRKLMSVVAAHVNKTSPQPS